MFDYNGYTDHPGRNPAHVPGGYTRYIEVPIDSKHPTLGTKKKRLRREENARVHSAHRRSRRRAA